MTYILTALIEGSNNMKLYSAWYCPFAQRAWMTFNYKNIAFEYVEIDPYLKSEDWLKISQNSGQVPVVVHKNSSGEETTIIDSNKIINFLDQHKPDDFSLSLNSSQSQNDDDYWFNHFGQDIIPYFYRFLKASNPGKARNDAQFKMIEGILKFAEHMLRNSVSSGPYFYGNKPSSIDISLIPFAYRIKLLLEHFRGFKLPTNDDVWKRYHNWYQAMIQLPAFKETGLVLEDYESRLIEFYVQYSEGGGQEDVTER